MIKLFFWGLLFTLTAAATNEAPLLAQVESQMYALQEDTISLASEKEQLEIKIDLIRAKIKNKKMLIVTRLKALSFLKRYNWGDLLLTSDFSKLDRNIKILKSLNKFDYDLFKDYSASFSQLALARKNLQETELDIKKNVEKLKVQQDHLHQLEKQHLQFLQLEKKDSLLVYKGHLTRPLESSIKQNFGTLLDKDNPFYLIKRGELYSASPGLPIRAIGPGQVIFRDVLMLWRETLIIQHPDNYYSVYAGINKLNKSVGDLVDKNEQLGAAAGEEFYFELRHFDNPINPKTWYRE